MKKILICLLLGLIACGADPAKDLLAAATAGDAHGIQQALQKGADVNCRGDKENTPLMLAVSAKKAEAVASLLVAGANPNLVNKRGYSALVLAVHALDEASVQALLAAKADANLKNKDGKTPLAYARESGHPEIIKLLTEAGAVE